MLLLDGVSVNSAKGATARFHRLNAPANGELAQRVHTIAHRVGRYLERQGWLERDAENDYLALDGVDDDPLSVLQGHSISYRIALGAGRRNTGCKPCNYELGATFEASVRYRHRNVQRLRR